MQIFPPTKNIVVITPPRKKEGAKGKKGKSVPLDLRGLKRDFSSPSPPPKAVRTVGN